MLKMIAVSIAAAAALAAGCGRDDPKPAASAPPPAPAAESSSASGGAQSATPNTPANIDKPAQKTEQTVPAQGQVDARQPEQKREFEKKGN